MASTTNNPDEEAPKPGAHVVCRRRREWADWQWTWRWMLDSFEGGRRYRDATYGPDRDGRDARNLIRHKRESPDPLEYPSALRGFPGNDAAAAEPAGVAREYGPAPGTRAASPMATAHDDDYEMRRARTTVPEFVREVVEIHAGKIYDQQVSRDGPGELVRWWADVDGAGTPMDDWAQDTLAPLLLVLGCLDVVVDRRRLPGGTRVENKGQEKELGLDTVIAAYILPENMVWWENDPAGNYVECLVREYHAPRPGDPDDDGGDGPGGVVPRFRHWTAATVALYTADGDEVEAPEPHGYPFVPIRRLIDQPRHRTPMVGKPRYEFVAECQFDYYNRDSELILSDTLQASPLLMGPQELCHGDRTISMGINRVLPKFRTPNGDYIDWEFITPDKGPAESIRQNLREIREKVDRAACLIKPAGITGTTGGTVSQSGYSKAMDHDSGNKLLGRISRVLARCERQLAEFALMCARRAPLTPADRAAIRITYPSRFQLKQGQEILGELERLMNVAAIDAGVAAMGDGAGGAGVSSRLASPNFSATVTRKAAGAAPTPTPDDQRGGNPRRPATTAASATPAPQPAVMPARYFAVPTLICEMFSEYTRATLTGRGDEVYDAIDREAMVFMHLSALPALGIADESEAMAGAGSDESGAGSDPLGQSAATAVSGAAATTAM